MQWKTGNISKEKFPVFVIFVSIKIILFKIIMKKAFYILSIAILIICAGCGKSKKDKLVGTWKLKSISGSILSATEFETVITIYDNGKWKSKQGVEDSSTGTWILSADEKKVKSVFTDEVDTTLWNIVSLDDELFVYTVNDDTTKITLEKKK